MTIFKNSKDGKLYTIQIKEKDGIIKYNAFPIGHEGISIQNCNINEFLIIQSKNGSKNFGFL